MAIDVYVYNCTADPVMLDKTDYLGTAVLHSGTVRGDIDVCRPEILIDGTVTGCSYAQIPAFNRYYFINPDTTVVRNGLTLLSLRVDPLMSYASQIKQLPCLCLRTEDRLQHTPMIVDNAVPCSASDWVAAWSLGSFNVGSINILVTAG